MALCRARLRDEGSTKSIHDSFKGGGQDDIECPNGYGKRAVADAKASFSDPDTSVKRSEGERKMGENEEMHVRVCGS